MRKIFNTISVLMLLIGAFIAFLPTLVVPDLIYPQRIDSSYVMFQHNQFADLHPNETQNPNGEIYYNPSDAGLSYENIEVQTSDSIVLKGWYIPMNDSTASTLVVIHDVNESKIKYLNFAKQMHDRGFKVCLYDLRAHGTSGGSQFSAGLRSVDDVSAVLDSLQEKEKFERFVLMGVGVGAGIALQAAVSDFRCEAVIAQSPYNDFDDYVQRYAEREWKGMRKFYTPSLKRKLYLVMQHDNHELTLSNITHLLDIPSFFIAASEDSITTPEECRAVFDSSIAENKDLILVRKANHDNVEMIGGEAYYNVISEFINKAIPKKSTKVRYKKLT